MKIFDQKTVIWWGGEGIKTSLSFFFGNAGSTRDTPPAAADVFASLRSDEGTRREGSNILETAPWDLMGAFGREAPGLSFGNLCTRISLRFHCRQMYMTLEKKRYDKTTIHTPTPPMEGIHENTVCIMKYYERNGKKIREGEAGQGIAGDRIEEKTHFVIKGLPRLAVEDGNNVLDEVFILSSASLSRRLIVSSDSSATSSPKPSPRRT